MKFLVIKMLPNYIINNKKGWWSTPETCTAMYRSLSYLVFLHFLLSCFRKEFLKIKRGRLESTGNLLQILYFKKKVHQEDHNIYSARHISWNCLFYRKNKNRLNNLPLECVSPVVCICIGDMVIIFQNKITAQVSNNHNSFFYLTSIQQPENRTRTTMNKSI